MRRLRAVRVRPGTVRPASRHGRLVARAIRRHDLREGPPALCLPRPAAVDGAGGALAATTTALQVGTSVALAANGPITSGQFLEIVSGTNTLARYTIKLVSNAAAANFATETTPA